MGEAAVRVTKACGYVNAGTVEFLYQDGEFYFLEMNTRLQVEHPVTELVTGIDLVAEQIRVASGEPLSFTQDDIVRRGHAIEVRINAEDPAGGAFLPSPGRSRRCGCPQGYGVRWDGGYEAGDEVSQFYDNLVGKLIVWGADRDTAIARMLRALDEIEIEGHRHDDPRRRWPSCATPTSSPASTRPSGSRSASTCPASPPTSTAPDVPTAASRAQGARDVDVEVNGRRFGVAVWVPESPGGQRWRRWAPAGGRRTAPPVDRCVGPGRGHRRRDRADAGHDREGAVSEGDKVEAGQTVCVLEAMKMENNIAADKSGTVKEVKVTAGQSVGSGDVVVVIE